MLFHEYKAPESPKALLPFEPPASIQAVKMQPYLLFCDLILTIH